MRKTMFKTASLPLVILAALGVAACAGPDPDRFGARVAAEGGDVQKIGKDWLKGEEMIAEGKDLIDDGEGDVDDGEALIAKGKKKIRKGEALIRDGERMMKEAERAYRERGLAAPTS